MGSDIMPNNLPDNIERLCAQYEVTEAGQKLLEVMIEPAARTMTVIQICELAGISKGSYYLLFKDQRFLDAYYQACKTACITAAMPTIQTVAGQAMTGNIEAAKIILQMTGLHQPTARVEHTVTHEAGNSLLDMYRARQKALD